MKSSQDMRLSAIYAAAVMFILLTQYAQAQRLYWAKSGGAATPSQLGRSNVDGTHVETLLTSGSPPISFRDVAIDRNNGHLYIADGLGGDVWRTDLNGDNLTVIVPGDRSGETVAVDPVHGKLYFDDTDSCFCMQQSNLDGSEVMAITQLEAPEDIAVDPQAGFVFHTNGQIIRRGLDGQNPVTIFTPAVGPGVDTVNGIDIDPIARKIYWTDGPTGFLQPPTFGHIYRANYDGSNVELVLDSNDIQFLFTNDITIDPMRDMIYWYNPVLLVLQSATTDGVVISPNLLGRQIDIVEGLAIDYIIPEPPTALVALATALLAATATSRRRPLLRPQRA
jgi:hypothetical protein